MKTLLLRPFIDSTIGTAPPISLMYLSSFLKSKGLEVRLLDNYVDRHMIGDLGTNKEYLGDLFDKIKDYGPGLIGMTLFSRELTDIATLCKLIKKEFNSVYIVLGGPHPTAMPKETMEEILECDFIVRGEAEGILYDLIRGISDTIPMNSIKGISFRSRDDGKVFHCENGNVIANLDALPFPDRATLMEGYRNNKYGSPIYGFPSDIMITSRGCPYQCHFCFKVCKEYRSRSAENVLEEIEWVVNNIFPQYIQIMDDSFTIERDKCLRILEHLIKNRYPCRFKVRSRVDAVDEKLLKKMKEAGIDTIVYGFESGSQQMLAAFNKMTSVERNIRTCKLTKKAGIDCFGDMILFYPGESLKTLRETEHFIRMAAPTGLKFYTLCPLPGTKVYNEAKENGSLVGDWGVNKKQPWVMLNEFKDLNEMEKIAKRMFLKRFFYPPRIFWLLKTLGKHFFRNPKMCLRVIFYSIFKKTHY